MTLEELKIETMMLIEEYFKPTPSYNSEKDSFNFTQDQDLGAKLPRSIGRVISEILAECPQRKTAMLEIKEGEGTLSPNVEKVESVTFKNRKLAFKVFESVLKISGVKNAQVEIVYYFRHDEIKNDTPNSVLISLPQGLQKILPYGIAADLLRGSGDHVSYEQKYFLALSKIKSATRLSPIRLSNLK